MTSSKTKTGLSETLPNKSTPATPKVFKLNKGPTKSDSNSSSPLPRSRLSIDRSPRSVDSKPIVGRQSPKIATPPEKQQRVLKESELQSQLVVVQEDLKKAKESFALAEKEKARVLEELKEAKRISDETSEKLSEALVSQKRAEESSEIEKFRADELEQASIEVAQKREDEWQRELESVRSQHALDVAALLSATQELQRVKHELGIVTDAKTTALSHAEDAMKIAEINAEKVELLSNELGRVKVMLESKSETESNETSELVKKLNLEVEFLKQELERTKATEKEVAEMEEIVEGLRIELKEEKKAELDMSCLVDEWKKKAELLENQVEEASQSEKSASKSLALATKQLEGNKALLQATESEVSSLKEEVELLEISVGKHNGDLEESNRLLQIAKHEKEEMAKTIDTLRSDLEHIKEEKMNALNNEMVAASTVQSLLEEKNKLTRELEVSRDEEEKSKKAMESLASALHEVSSEARESKEKLLTTQAELQDVESQIENLKLVLQATEEKYETMIDEAEYEIDCLKRSVEISQLEAKNSKAELDEKEQTFIAALNKMEEDNAAVKKEMDRLVEISKADWEERELSFVSAIKETEDELFGVKKEVDRLTNLLKETQDSSKAAKEDGTRLLNTLKQAESDASSAKEVAEKALTESLKLKESLLDKENELQNITQENEELRFRETSAQKKAEELSKLLEETTAKKAEENGDLADSEKDYDLLPKMDELVEENVDEEALQNPNSEFSLPQPEEHRGENLLNNAGHVEPKQNGYGKPEEEDSAEVEAKMWDNCEVNEKDLSPEREHKPEPEPESFEDELESKIDSDSFDQINGLSSDTMENGESSQITQQKKKKPLLRKFGSLLKKKSNAK